MFNEKLYYKNQYNSSRLLLYFLIGILFFTIQAYAKDCCKSPLEINDDDGYYKCKHSRMMDTFVYRYKCINETTLSKEQTDSPYLQNLSICHDCIPKLTVPFLIITISSILLIVGIFLFVINYYYHQTTVSTSPVHDNIFYHSNYGPSSPIECISPSNSQTNTNINNYGTFP